MNACARCGSYAINPHCHGRDNNDLDLCDVCYWRKRADGERLAKEDARRALEKIADWRGGYGPFPETNPVWCAMAVVTAREAIPRDANASGA